jgi:hypothetical protein
VFKIKENFLSFSVNFIFQSLERALCGSMISCHEKRCRWPTWTEFFIKKTLSSAFLELHRPRRVRALLLWRYFETPRIICAHTSQI